MSTKISPGHSMWPGKTFGDMKKHVNLMALNHRCVKSKWAFKLSVMVCTRICLVECGYSQVLGVDFSKNYSPMVKNITFDILILMIIHF